jgi:ABC-2 type transport system permease protein
MRPELIVAGKEFRDHVTSKRFLIIFAILLLVCAYAIVSGMDNYNKSLDSYKQSQQQPWFQEQIAELQKQIADAQARGDSQEMIDSLQAQIDSMLSMPSILTFFYSLGQYFSLIGMVLGIALGFDLITREKEEGSLKSLLSHPVYRDSVINGKTLGAIAVLVTSMGAAFLLTIAIVLFFGVVPSADEFLRIAALFVMALMFCLTFFAIAMAASTVAKNSSMAVLFALGIVFGLTIFGMFSNEIVQFVSGPPPESGPIIMYSSAENGIAVDDVKVAGASTGASPGGALPPSDNSTDPDVMPMPTTPPEDMPGLIVAPGGQTGIDEWQKYYERQELIRKALDSISPMTNFQNYIAQALISDTSSIMPMFSSMKRVGYQNKKSTVWDALGSVWVNILVMLAEMIAAFGIAYVKFLRTDIR